MTATTPATREALVHELVQRVAPAVRASAAASEAGRRLAPEAMAALIDAGIFRTLLPATYGGADLGPVYGAKLIEEVSRIDSAAGWITMICATGSWLTVVLPPQAADEMLADPRAVVCGSFNSQMAAEPVQGGYRVSGRAAFASGCNYATWFVAQALVMENGAPKLRPTGMPVALAVFFPAGDAEILDNWNTLGMRGTGSHDFRVTDILVPEHRVWPVGPFVPVNPAFADPLARMGMWWLTPTLACVSLGIARSAIADFIELAQTKTPSYTQVGLADKPIVQDQVARARAAVDAARSYLYGALATAEEILQTAPRLSIEQGIPLALAGSFGVEAACRAV
ncbi:MAG TPA: acyl-CoA dehydrogenase family protein, partial [Dehalococcoidia bacterium]|nr:acyl-CoA dehydrogenase family protein [Dehalococcoidia bacterium]